MGNLVAVDFTEKFLKIGRFGDKFGPELVVAVIDRRTKAFYGGFVGDNSSLCPSGSVVSWNGGIRLETSPSILRLSRYEQLGRLWRDLARKMTLKLPLCFPLDQPPKFGLWGGGKAKIVDAGYQGNRKDLVTDWTEAMLNFRLSDGRKLLGGAFIGGADAGLTEKDLELICKVAGDNKCVTGGPGQVKYESIGATGLILVHAAKILAEYCGYRWDESFRFSIAGLGQVGKGVLQWLAHSDYRGPFVNSASNREVRKKKGEAVRNKNGIPPKVLLAALQDKKKGILSLVGKKGTKEVAPGFPIFDGDAQVVVLALPVEGVIGFNEAHRVFSRIVLSGTNSGITERGYRVLCNRGILAPLDAMVNMGAASIAKSSWHGVLEKKCIALAKQAVEANLKWALDKTTRDKGLDQVVREEIYRRLRAHKLKA